MINRVNYHLIEDFLAYELGTRGRSERTIGRYRSWLRHLLIWADEIPFSAAHKIIPSFGQFIKKSHHSLALESQKKLIETARMFFRWAKLYHPAEFAKLPPHWVSDLTPPVMNRDSSNLEYVKYEEVLQLVTLPIDDTNLALWRDQAAVAMFFLSGARGGAFTTLPISAVHLNVEHPFINQWPELGVHTKKNKKATTFLFTNQRRKAPGFTQGDSRRSSGSEHSCYNQRNEWTHPAIEVEKTQRQSTAAL